jgi:hypothetical protein
MLNAVSMAAIIFTAGAFCWLLLWVRFRPGRFFLAQFLVLAVVFAD